MCDSRFNLLWTTRYSGLREPWWHFVLCLHNNEDKDNQDLFHSLSNKVTSSPSRKSTAGTNLNKKLITSSVNKGLPGLRSIPEVTTALLLCLSHEVPRSIVIFLGWDGELFFQIALPICNPGWREALWERCLSQENPMTLIKALERTQPNRHSQGPRRYQLREVWGLSLAVTTPKSTRSFFPRLRGDSGVRRNTRD